MSCQILEAALKLNCWYFWNHLKKMTRTTRTSTILRDRCFFWTFATLLVVECLTF